MNDAQQRGRRTLILIALLFATPIFLAMYMYYSGSSLGPIATTEHGDLISPPRLLPDGQLTTDGGQSLREVWSMIVLADRQCAATCQQALVTIRQVRLSLGPKMTRMQTVYMPASNAVLTEDLQNEHPVLIIAAPESSADIRDAIGPFEPGQIFLVDPLGNLMMSYPPNSEMGDIRKDLAQLFKLSGIG